VTREEALKCAAILKGGYWKKQALTSGRRKGGRRHEEVREWRAYYSSIHEACQMEPVLKQVCEEHGVTPAYLLRRTHEEDPNLVMRCRDEKRALSAEQRADRMAAAKRNLDEYNKGKKKYLARIVWIDECAMWMVPKNTKRRVYCDAHDEGVHAVVPLQTVQKGDKVKVRVLLAVTHQFGACFMEFMTGTTGLKRLDLQGKGPYKVGGSSHVQPSELRCTLQQPLIASLNQSM
jgi:hypothetical protein